MRVSEILSNIQFKMRESENVLKNTLLGDDVLIIRHRNGKPQYYRRARGLDTAGKYVSPKKTEEIKKLEMNGYVNVLRRTAEKNIERLGKAETLLEGVEELDNVFFDIPEDRRHLIEPYCKEKVDEEYARKWMEMEPPFHNEMEGDTLKLSNGIKVRSKSEYIIAERLIAAGVPFYYEYPVKIDYTYLMFPDFLVLNKRTKQEYYWEHFGLISNPNYAASMQDKIESYARNGIALGKNLIISMESEKHPLDVEYVDTIIKQFLL